MRSRAHPPERVSLCAITASLILSVLLPGPAAGVTQRHCPTKPHNGRHDGATGERGSRCWCAESACHVSKVKAWEQRGACVIGMESASNPVLQCGRSLEVADKLSAQLRAAEDRIRELDNQAQYHEERADRAERWLHQISVEIEHNFFGRDDSRSSQPPSQAVSGQKR
jgi:hypothetical protein